MHLRLYQREDLPRMADILAAGNLPHPLQIYFRPWTEKYYASYRDGGLRLLCSRLTAPGCVCWVAETDEHDAPPSGAETREGGELSSDDRGGLVVGFAIWLRAGDGKVAKNWQRPGHDWQMKIESALQSLWLSYFNFCQLDWSMDYTRWSSIKEPITRPFDAEVFPDGWEMSGLSVAPEYQRRGLGALMLNWGINQATAENVPVFVKSSPNGVSLYEKAGFRSFEKIHFDTIDLGEPGMQCLVWEPPALQGRWFDRAKEASQKSDRRRNG